MKKSNRSLLAYIESLGISLDQLQEEMMREYWRQKQRVHRERQQKFN